MAVPNIILSRLFILVVLVGVFVSTAFASSKKTSSKVLKCSVTSPTPNTVWALDSDVSIAWSCTGKKNNSMVIVIELQSGSPQNPTYVDTINDEEPSNDKSFTFPLSKKYAGGNSYYIRIRTKVKGTPDPKYKEQNDALPWSWAGPITFSNVPQTITPSIPVPTYFTNPNAPPIGPSDSTIVTVAYTYTSVPSSSTFASFTDIGTNSTGGPNATSGSSNSLGSSSSAASKNLNIWNLVVAVAIVLIANLN